MRTSLATAGPPVLSFRRRLPRCWPPFSTACPACARSLSSAATPRNRAGFSGRFANGRDVHDFADVVARGRTELFTAPTLSDDVAFWLYTSGSTGEPKGVKHVHTTPVA